MRTHIHSYNQHKHLYAYLCVISENLSGTISISVEYVFANVETTSKFSLNTLSD